MHQVFSPQMRQQVLLLRVLLISLVLPSLVLTSCGGRGADQVTVGDLSVDKAAPVQPNAEIQVLIPVDAPASVEVTFEWTVNDGQIKSGQGTSAILYQAPATGGTYGINLKVKAGDTVYLRDVSVTVEGESIAAVEGDVAQCTIDVPADGATAPCEVAASGTYADGVSDPIWLLVVVDGMVYPQDAGGKAFGKIGGRWYGTVRFGVCTEPETDVGKTFRLVAVTAGEECNEAFEKWIADGRPTGSYSPLTDIPDDCKECMSIRVTRE